MLGSYIQGNDPQYLGVNGKNYYAKPWGNDSSNIQSILNGPAYWKRVYYRENIANRFAQDDIQAEKREAAALAAEVAMTGDEPAPMRRCVSESAITKKPPGPVPDGYAKIKESMAPFVQSQGKPKIRAMNVGEPLHFFNTLDNKYHMKAGGKNMSWNVSTQTHRSSKNEINWVLSNYFRTDSQAVLSGAGCQIGGKP
ncbi:unnamed protein product, partial [Polarella glacialis]